jgi:hypothetical protein
MKGDRSFRLNGPELEIAAAVLRFPTRHRFQDGSHASFLHETGRTARDQISSFTLGPAVGMNDRYQGCGWSGGVTENGRRRPASYRARRLITHVKSGQAAILLRAVTGQTAIGQN